MSHETIAKVASDVTYTGAAITTVAAAPHYVFGLTMDQWSVLGIVFGMAMAFAGWLTNLYFKRQHYKLTEKALELRGLEDGD